MVLFWVAAAALSLAAAILIVRGASRAAHAPLDSDPSLGLYQRQLSEIDDLVERGVLGEGERRAARAEAGRRLLAAADRKEPQVATGRPARPLLIAAAVAAPLAAAAVYLAIGAPGLRDQPYAARVDEWRRADPRTLDPQRLAAVLELIVRQRPGDVDGLRFLAQAQMASDDPFGAEDSLRKALAAAPERADLWMMLGGALAAQADGAFSADARAALERALRLDPQSAAVRYYTGRARIETGAREEGLALWRTLLAELAEGTPEKAQLTGDIAAVEKTGRLPDAAAQAQAGGAEMQAAVRGMVEGLAARLKSNPDDPDGWARLVRSYSVLGETAKRDEALAAARARFKDQPEVLRTLDEAAKVQ
jgi:cytochrome c-type biogenesis protein CcmH